ncbi:MAG: methyltransferase family protein [Promethearchaeota archaeon]
MNIIIYWTVTIRNKDKYSRFLDAHNKLFPYIWSISSFLIPIINSSFLEPIFWENLSYFREIWIWFLLLSFIFHIVAIRVYSLTKKTLKQNNADTIKNELNTQGIYKIVRHPKYLSRLLIFLGLTFMFDSVMGIILSPFIVLLTEIHCDFQEKYVYRLKFTTKYENYMKKTPYRVIPIPYNYLLYIIGAIILYIGFMNFYSNF